MKNQFKIWVIANIECIMLFFAIIFFVVQMFKHPEVAQGMLVFCLVAAIPGAPSKNLTETCVKVLIPLGFSSVLLYWLYDKHILSMFWIVILLLVTMILTIWNIIFTYRNIDNVISRSMRYRYTSVDLITYKFKFLLDRFLVVFSIHFPCSLFILAWMN